MEIKIFLTTLLQRYDWQITPEYEPNNYHQAPLKIEGKLQAQVQIR